MPKSIKPSKKTQAEQFEVEIVVLGPTYKGRRLFAYIGNPYDPKIEDTYKEMSITDLRRILECYGYFIEGNKASYHAMGQSPTSDDFVNLFTGFSQRPIAIKTTFKKGNGGYADSNNVVFLSPHTKNTDYKDYVLLKASTTGEVIPPANKPASISNFGGSVGQPATAPARAEGSFPFGSPHGMTVSSPETKPPWIQ